MYHIVPLGFVDTMIITGVRPYIPGGLRMEEILPPVGLVDPMIDRFSTIL